MIKKKLDSNKNLFRIQNKYSEIALPRVPAAAIIH